MNLWEDTPAVAPKRRRGRVLAGIAVAAAILVPSAAMAIHQFPDVPDSNPFHDEIDWSVDAGIFNGYADGTFKPANNITRQAAAANVQRMYNLFAGTSGVIASDTPFSRDSADGTTYVDVTGMTTTVVIPPGTSGRIVADFSAESTCVQDAGTFFSGYCKVQILSNGSAMNPTLSDDFAFDSSDNAGESFASWESHAMRRYTGILPPGTYTIKAQAAAARGTSFCIPPCTPSTVDNTLSLDDMVLTAQVLFADS